MFCFVIDLHRTHSLCLLLHNFKIVLLCPNCWERIEIEKRSKETPDHKSKFPLNHKCTTGGARNILEGEVN